MRPTASLSLSFWLACLTLHSASASAQVVSNPNFIRGQFSIENVATREWFDDFNDLSLSIRADSLPPAPESLAQNIVPASSLDELPLDYELAVESSAVGIRHELSHRLLLRRGRSRSAWLKFPDIDTARVFESPAPPLILDLSTCLGVEVIDFVDEEGLPVSVSSGYYNDSISSGGVGSDKTRMPAILTTMTEPGSRTLEIDIRTPEGTQETEIEVSPSCDEVHFHQVVVAVTPPPENGSVIGRAAITGMPHTVSEDSFMKVDFERGEVAADGTYEVLDVQPGTHNVTGSLQVGSGSNLQHVTLPTQRVHIEEGETLDLGDCYVFDPSWVAGDVEVHGPAGEEHRELLQLARFTTSAGGASTSSVSGGVAPGTTSFFGDYENILLISPDLAERSWQHPRLNARLKRSVRDGDYVSCDFEVEDQGRFTGSAGETAEFDMELCLSTITIGFEAGGLDVVSR